MRDTTRVGAAFADGAAEYVQERWLRAPWRGHRALMEVCVRAAWTVGDGIADFLQSLDVEPKPKTVQHCRGHTSAPHAHSLPPLQMVHHTIQRVDGLAHAATQSVVVLLHCDVVHPLPQEEVHHAEECQQDEHDADHSVFVPCHGFI